MARARASLKAATKGREARKLSREIAAARNDGPVAIQKVLAPAIARQVDDRVAAAMLCWVLEERILPFEKTAEILTRIFDAHRDDIGVLVALGDAIEAARDIDDLNAPPPDDRLFADLAKRLSEMQLACDDRELEKDLVMCLGTTARLNARQKDGIAERAYVRWTELDPKDPNPHYNLGLFYKTRGRFAEGVAANQRALALSRDGSDAMKWNLGICATGAGEGLVALDLWRSLGNKLETGDHGLPNGGYPPCKVRLAERPLATRDGANDDPGLQETIWIKRLSPCHGIVDSVLYQENLGTDFGDTVLFDGAPITYHRYGENEYAVFPHLTTLHRGNFHFYPFAATQLEGGTVDKVNEALDNDILIYSHTENCYTLCAPCMRDENTDHAHEPKEHQVIRGRIAAPPEIVPADLLAMIDTAFQDHQGARLFSPDLARAAGQPDRARLEEPRYAMISEEEAF